jgi:protein-S-isoprenylcysteine O-methyltransferase Ste14
MASPSTEMTKPENTTATVRDCPGVAVVPPLLYGGAFIVVLILHWLWPLRIVSPAIAFWLGLGLIILALALAAWGRRTMHASGTNISPLKPAVSLVTSGPYRFTRNPLYVAISLLFLGLTMLLNSWWGVVVLAPVLVILHWGVVRREERYLELKFGKQYADYRSRVRRYL